MQTTVTSWSFPQLTLKEIVGLAKVLNLGGVDLGYFYKSAINRQAIIEEPEQYAQELKTYNHQFPCLYHLFGEDLYQNNIADLTALDNNIANIKQVITFCNTLGIGQIMLLPGMIMPGKTREQSLNDAIITLNKLVPLIVDAGLKVSVEPHIHGLLESVDLAKQMVKQVPNLGLTLDYAHLICLGFTQQEIDTIAPLASHIHLRQARPGKLQEKMALGTINFNALLSLLNHIGYQGYVAYEYVHQDYMNTLSEDVLTETILMRDLVQTHHSSTTKNDK